MWQPLSPLWKRSHGGELHRDVLPAQARSRQKSVEAALAAFNVPVPDFQESLPNLHRLGLLLEQLGLNLRCAFQILYLRGKFCLGVHYSLIAFFSFSLANTFKIGHVMGRIEGTFLFFG